jgi:hypothetical protein
MAILKSAHDTRIFQLLSYSGMQRRANTFDQELGIVSPERYELECALRAGVAELVDAADSKCTRPTLIRSCT